MRYIKQTRPMNCGQTCVAMVTGKSLRAVESIIGTEGTRTRKILRAFDELQYPVKTRRFRLMKRGTPLPRRCLVRILWNKKTWPSKGNTVINIYAHMAVLWDGKWYDPGQSCEKGKNLIHYGMPRHNARISSYLDLT